MTIYELSDLIQCNLVLTRYSNQGSRWSAALEYCETKCTADDGCLTGTYGNGDSPDGAIRDYVAQLRELPLLVAYAANKDMRREYGIPRTLTA